MSDWLNLDTNRKCKLPKYGHYCDLTNLQFSSTPNDRCNTLCDITMLCDILTKNTSTSSNELNLKGRWFDGRIIRVKDGDTFDININGVISNLCGLSGHLNCNITARLYGINCDESDTITGQQISEIISDKFNEQSVRVFIIDVDKYGRCLSIIYHNGILINQWILNQYSWATRAYFGGTK